jgi:hypothetical protein
VIKGTTNQVFSFCILKTWFPDHSLNKIMIETQLQAKTIHESLGSVDGEKHVLQMIYFSYGAESNELANYWKDVYKYLKNER